MKMIADIKVGETVLVGVETTIREDGSYTYRVPDVLDNGDTLQQVTIDTGMSEPVKKADIIGAITNHLILTGAINGA